MKGCGGAWRGEAVHGGGDVRSRERLEGCGGAWRREAAPGGVRRRLEVSDGRRRENRSVGGRGGSRGSGGKGGVRKILSRVNCYSSSDGLVPALLLTAIGVALVRIQRYS